MKVKVIGIENGKISLSSKQLKGDPWEELPKRYQVWDIIEGEIVRYVPYGVFVRVYEDINGLVHLSELSQKTVNNPNEIVKLGQIVKAKLILIDPKNRKIGLSMKDLEPKAEGAEEKPAKKAAKSKWSLEDVVKKIEEKEE